MQERNELQKLISEMDETQFELFISQMRRLLSEEVDEPGCQKVN